jgi:hypothetical protein
MCSGGGRWRGGAGRRRAYHAGHTQVAEQHWSDLQAIWSRAWAANCAALEFMQDAGLERFGPVRPQRWVVASFEHHCGPHGIQHPHIHNIARPSPGRSAEIRTNRSN